jgi:hypothetical protein
MKIAGLAMLASLLVGGCAATSPPNILPAYNAADPSMGIRTSAYQGVIADYHDRQPADPRNWRGQNDKLAPQDAPAPEGAPQEGKAGS